MVSDDGQWVAAASTEDDVKDIDARRSYRWENETVNRDDEGTPLSI